MKNNKGFIAISLIYSFFLVFLMVLISTLTNYVHNRILLSDIKKTTQEELNELSEFNPISLENKAFDVGTKITYADDSWIVLNDIGNSVILILERSLTSDELSTGLNPDYHSSINGNTINMCLNGYNQFVCCYNESAVGQYNLYYWDDSLVKEVIDNWLLNNALLQKALVRETLLEMDFSDERKTYKSYIRIPSNGEYSNSNIWNLTYAGNNYNQSLIKINNTNVTAHIEKKEIKPVIRVKKSTS